jgi:hypothetical protein
LVGVMSDRDDDDDATAAIVRQKVNCSFILVQVTRRQQPAQRKRVSRLPAAAGWLALDCWTGCWPRWRLHAGGGAVHFVPVPPVATPGRACCLCQS